MSPKPPRGLRLDRRTSITFRLIAISNKIVASASQTYMRHYRIGVMEWRVVALLAAERGISARDITQLSGVTAGSVSRAIQALRSRGYVTSKGDRSDNRRSLLQLTAAGRKLHDEVIVSSLAREKLLLTGFTSQERRALLGYLRRLMANVSSVNAYEPRPSTPSSRRIATRSS